MFINKIEYAWKNEGKRYEKELDKTAILMLMGAVVLNYPNNNRIASKLSEVFASYQKDNSGL